MNFKKVIVFLLSLAIVTLITKYNCFARPWSECHGWNFPEFNTTSEANKLANILYNMGYTGYGNSGKNASDIRSTLGYSGIFVTIGHGDPGRVVCIDDNGNKTYLSANISNDRPSYSIENMYRNSDSLKDVKLAAFFGCYTAQTSSKFGNLLSICKNYGVDVVIGFKDSINVNQQTYFATQFFTYLSNGSKIYSAKKFLN